MLQKYLSEFSSEAMWAWGFLFGELFNYKFNLFNSLGLFSLVHCNWVLVAYDFEELVLFKLLNLWLCIKLFIVFPYSTFNDCRICSDILCSILDICYLWFLPFYFCQFGWQSFIILLTQKKELAFYLMIFCINFIDFCYHLQYLLYSSSTFESFKCFSFSTFLR